MIVCSCSGVTDRDIGRSIAGMRAVDPDAFITPGKVYRALGKMPECGRCIRLFVERMRCDEHMAGPTELACCAGGSGDHCRGRRAGCRRKRATC